MGNLFKKSLKLHKRIFDPAGVGEKTIAGSGGGGAGPSGTNWWDSIGKDGPDDLTKKRIGEIYRLFQGAEGSSALGFAKAKATSSKGIPLINQSFDKAQANALRLADTTKRTLLQNEPGRVSASNMELGSRGLDNSSLGRLASRGIRGDTTRALQSIDDFFTAQSNRMETQRAGAISSIYQQNAGFDAAGGSEQAQLKTALAQMISQFQQAPKKPDAFTQALGFAGDAAPLLALL